MERKAQQEAEAPEDRRRWRDKRRHNNQPDKRLKRGMTRGCSATRGRGVGVREASV